MAYLITCAGSKLQPEYNPSRMEALSFDSELRQARNLMIDVSGISLDWDHTLPAWKLYSGTYSRMYPRVHEHNWTKPTVEIKILSALFGWISHTDLVPYYDLKMTDKLENDYRVNRMWFNIGALSELIKCDDVDLLSIKYRAAINGAGLPVARFPGVTFGGWGDAKGIWLNDQLENVPN